MKKFILFVLFSLLISVNIFAQKDEKTLGGQLIYGSDIERFGFGARFQYGLTDPLRISASLNYFFPEGAFDYFETNVDLHYLLPVAEKLQLYPLGGFSIVHGSIGSFNRTRLGLNLGGGLQCELSDQLYLTFEVKYNTATISEQVILAAGVAYKF